MLQDPTLDMQWTSESGMTFLHMAARSWKTQWVEHLISACPELVDATTYVDRTPGNWTPLQCAVESAKTKSPELAFHLRRTVEMLVEQMSAKKICSVSTSGSTVFHQIVARGHIGIIKIVAAKLDSDTLMSVLSVGNKQASHSFPVCCPTIISFVLSGCMCYITQCHPAVSQLSLVLQNDSDNDHGNT